MASQVLVSGRVLHGTLTPDQVKDRLEEHFAQVQLGGQDLSITLPGCIVNCVRSTQTTLDFTIEINTVSIPSGRGIDRVVAATEMLIRSTDTTWDGFQAVLHKGRFRKQPVLDMCLIEDISTRNVLLVRDPRNPIRSAAAWFSYGISIGFLFIMAAMVWWQLGTEQSSSDRMANLLSITLSLVVAAIATPIPIFMQWLEWKKNIVWRYKRSWV
jgi:hypothetical protein